MVDIEDTWKGSNIVFCNGEKDVASDRREGGRTCRLENLGGSRGVVDIHYPPAHWMYWKRDPTCPARRHETLDFCTLLMAYLIELNDSFQNLEYMLRIGRHFLLAGVDSLVHCEEHTYIESLRPSFGRSVHAVCMYRLSSQCVLFLKDWKYTWNWPDGRNDWYIKKLWIFGYAYIPHGGPGGSRLHGLCFSIQLIRIRNISQGAVLFAYVHAHCTKLQRWCCQASIRSDNQAKIIVKFCFRLR